MKSKIHTIRITQSCPERSRRDAIRTFSPLNNKKGSKIKGKITKSYTTFSENKPNLVNSEIGVSPFETSKYEISPACRGEKQTQFKANSNPIKANFGPISRVNKAKQSQFKPNFKSP